MLGELRVPTESDENPCTRCNMVLKDRKFCTYSLGIDRNKREKCPINDQVNEELASFAWHDGTYDQDCISKLDQDFCVSRNYPKLFLEIDARSVWKFSVNSTFRECNKECKFNQSYCESCDGCNHYKFVDEYFYESHNEVNNFDNKHSCAAIACKSSRLIWSNVKKIFRLITL